MKNPFQPGTDCCDAPCDKQHIDSAESQPQLIADKVLHHLELTQHADLLAVACPDFYAACHWVRQT